MQLKEVRRTFYEAATHYYEMHGDVITAAILEGTAYNLRTEERS